MKKLLIAALFGVGLSASAQADTFGFSCITNNSAANCNPSVAAQFTMDVTAFGTGQASFVFNNSGPAASSIADIYFDFGLPPDYLVSPIAVINNGVGVDFSIGANPGNLPGGNTISFSATNAGVTADSNPPAQPNGVNPGETLQLIFTIANGYSFQDVLNEINGLAPAGPGGTVNPIAAQALRVGLHVQGFANGGSESFVNEGGGNQQNVPEPGTLALLGLALAGLGAMRRRFV